MSMREDDDIKIAPSSFAGTRPYADSGEAAALEFLEQKECGNIDKARALGKSYADAIIHIETGPVAEGKKQRTQREFHQQLLLYSYIVNRVIADHSPNSIVAQACLNIFYTEIEAASQELHRHVSDMAAFSLYVLCERSKTRTDDDIGEIYARLCDFAGRRDIIDEANTFYKNVYGFCLDKLDAIGFIK